VQCITGVICGVETGLARVCDRGRPCLSTRKYLRNQLSKETGLPFLPHTYLGQCAGDQQDSLALQVLLHCTARECACCHCGFGCRWWSQFLIARIFLPYSYAFSALSLRADSCCHARYSFWNHTIGFAFHNHFSSFHWLQPVHGEESVECRHCAACCCYLVKDLGSEVWQYGRDVGGGMLEGVVREYVVSLGGRT
jgi:hypothetical protein